MDNVRQYTAAQWDLAKELDAAYQANDLDTLARVRVALFDSFGGVNGNAEIKALLVVYRAHPDARPAEQEER